MPKERSATYKTLTIAKKLEILDEANVPGVSDRSVAKCHNVSRTSIGDWRKQEEKLRKEMVNYREEKKQVTNSSSKHFFPEMEIALSSWITTQRLYGLAVTPKMVRDMAKTIQSDLFPETKNFCASNGWFHRFCKRQQFSIRRRSTLNQFNPTDIIHKVLSFLLHFRVVKEEFPDSVVWACDETPVFFDQVHRSTVDKVGAREIKINTTGGDKKMVTCMLLAASDGGKARPTVVFKGKGKTKEDKELTARQDVLVMFSSNAWMQTSNTVQFLQSMFTGEETTLLCWDSYRCHYCPEVREVMRKRKVKNLILPGGTTRVLQTADVCWNGPFKHHLRELWALWMREGEKSYTKSGRVRSPSKTELVNMILKSWNQITEEQIKYSFLVCGQGENLVPDNIHCMKEGNDCHAGLSKLKELLALPPNERDLAFKRSSDDNDNFVSVDDDDNLMDPLE